MYWTVWFLRLMSKEVPVTLQAIHDNIVEVPQVEIVEVVKEVPKVEIRYVEKTVEVPTIEWAPWSFEHKAQEIQNFLAWNC